MQQRFTGKFIYLLVTIRLTFTLQLSYCEDLLVTTFRCLFRYTEGEFSTANAPNQLSGSGRKPDHPKETYADTGRMCKLRTDSVPSFMFPEVDDNLLRFVDIEGEIIAAAPVHQILYLFPVLCLVIV